MQLVITGSPHEDIPNLLDAIREAFENFMRTPELYGDTPKATRFTDTVASSSRNSTSQPVHTPDVPAQLTYLSQRVEETAKLVISLQDRLEQYLRPDDSTQKGEASDCPSPVCAAGDQLRQLTEQVGHINARLANTLQRLEAS